MCGTLKVGLFHSQNCAKNEKNQVWDQNLISFECGQDTSACQILGNFFHEFYWECMEIQNCDPLIKSKECQNEDTQQTVAKI